MNKPLDRSPLVDPAQEPEKRMQPSATLVSWMRRKASILRQPVRSPFVRFYSDDDYAAFAQALDDGARALETADAEIESLLASRQPAPVVDLTAFEGTPQACRGYEFYEALRQTPQYRQAEVEGSAHGPDWSAADIKKRPADAAKKIESLRTLLAWFTLRYEREHTPDPFKGTPPAQEKKVEGVRLPAVVEGHAMIESIEGFERRCLIHIARLQENNWPDRDSIEIIAQAVRCAREYSTLRQLRAAKATAALEGTQTLIEEAGKRARRGRCANGLSSRPCRTEWPDSPAGWCDTCLLAALAVCALQGQRVEQELDTRGDGERRAAGPTGSTAASNEAARG